MRHGREAVTLLREPFSPSHVKKVDRGDVYWLYRDWPSLAKQGFEAAADLPRGGFKRVVVLGMGGSAAAGDIIASWLSGREGVEAVSVFNGLVPQVGLEGTLALACSASGGTVETLEMTRTAHQRGATVVSISAGGELEKVSERCSILHIRSPATKAPRYMLPFMLFACVRLVDQALSLSADREVRDAVDSMERSWGRIRIDSPRNKNPAKDLALRLHRKVPKVYGTRLTRGVGIRFTKAVNENAKSNAFFEEVPEALHNDVESWETPARGFVPVLLRHSADDELDSTRLERLGAALKAKGAAPIMVRGTAGRPLAEMVSMLYTLDMASYYLAVAGDVDPLPTPLLTSLRHQIGST
jgi:glucose/mannose-6-phosphate isomerase